MRNDHYSELPLFFGLLQNHAFRGVAIMPGDVPNILEMATPPILYVPEWITVVISDDKSFTHALHVKMWALLVATYR